MSHTDPDGPDWAAAQTAHETEVRQQRMEGRIAQLEAKLRTIHAELNKLEADARGDSPFADGVRHAVRRLRPHAGSL